MRMARSSTAGYSSVMHHGMVRYCVGQYLQYGVRTREQSATVDSAVLRLEVPLDLRGALRPALCCGGPCPAPRKLPGSRQRDTYKIHIDNSHNCTGDATEREHACVQRRGASVHCDS